MAAPANDSCLTCSLQTQVCRGEKGLDDAGIFIYLFSYMHIYAGDSVALMAVPANDSCFTAHCKHRCVEVKRDLMMRQFWN